MDSLRRTASKPLVLFLPLIAGITQFAVGFACTAQLPLFVPDDGLVAWYNFDSNAEDLSGNGNHLDEVSVNFVSGHNDSSIGAVSFPSLSSMCVGDVDLQIPESGAFSVSFWFRVNDPWAYNRFAAFSIGGTTSSNSFSGQYASFCWDENWFYNNCDNSNEGFSCRAYTFGNEQTFESCAALDGLLQWRHAVLTFDGDLSTLFVNGEWIREDLISDLPQEFETSPLYVGPRLNVNSSLTERQVDNLGVWNRALNAEEVASLYTESPTLAGCTDLGACNFNPDAIVDDGSCFEAPFIAASGADIDSVSTCSGESISLSAMGTTSALDSTLLDAFTMTVNSYYSRTTPVLESGHTYRLIGNGRYGFADGWSHNDPAWNYAWDQETGSKVYCNGTQDASEDVRWLYDGAANFQRPDNDYHNNDNNAFCNGSDKTYAWTIEGDGNAHVISWEDCCYGDNSGSLDFWLYELTGVPGGPETTWSTGDQGATTELTPSESQWVTLTTILDGISLCQDSIWIEVVTSGCNDENACNYSMLDVCSVDCVYPLVGEDCEAGAVACAAGTVWDAESQTCVVAVPAYLNDPGEAAILNPCYFDSNGNGLVEVTDLMNVLSVFGLACGEIPEAAEFSCGNPLSYQGYDYETVQIGEQCWFAENLRAQNYRDGLPISEVNDCTTWSGITEGAYCSYENQTDHSLVNGLLYNWFVTDDALGVCPSGWHVPTDSEWMALEIEIGMSESEANGTFLRGTTEGDELKSATTWNGMDAHGFNSLPSGWRSPGCEYSSLNVSTYYWSSTPSGSLAIGRGLTSEESGIWRMTTYQLRNAFSVRCIKDAE